MGKNFKLAFSILCLIITDQIIKLYIAGKLMYKRFNICGSIITFQPCINKSYSWINSLIGGKVGLMPHIIFNIIVIIFSLFIFNFIKENYIDNKILYMVVVFWYAGIICSLIDRVFWGGSLDYIKLKGLFVFDLKDVYISILEIAICIIIIFNYKKLKIVDEKKIYIQFKNYIKCKFNL